MHRAAETEQRKPDPAERLATLERELLHASREAHRLNREVETLRRQRIVERDDREELLTVVGHELRTPVTVIAGYARLLLAEEAGPISSQQRGFLEQALKACEKLDHFVARTLESAQPHVEVAALEVTTSPLTELVDEVADALRGPLSNRDLAFENAADPAHEARFDPHGIERVLLNLVGNAIRFARHEVRVSTRAYRDAGRPLVELSVSDDGPGVAEAERERIFAPYVRGAERGHGGVGLGLALCRRLVESHGGEIGVEPVATGGSRFFLTLPGKAG